MHRNYFSRLGLCAPADDNSAPPSGAPVAPPSAAPEVVTPPATAPPAAPAPAPVVTKPPGVIDQALGMVRDKGALVAENTSLKASNGAMMAENATLKTQLATVTGERDALQADMKRLEGEITKANAEKTTVETEVTHQLASAGVPDVALPKGGPAPVASAGSLDDQINALNQQIEDTKDPVEKGRLSNQVWDLMVKRGGSVKISK